MSRISVDRTKLIFALDVIKFVLILVLLTMFVNFNQRIAQQSSDTKAIAQGTNNIVKSQGDILNAIKQVTDDTRMTAAQQTAIIICMLQVPITQRTTDLQTQCRDQATSSDSGSASGTTQSSTGTRNSVSSLNRNPVVNPPQSNSSQSPTPPDPIVLTPVPTPGIVDIVLMPVKNLVNAL